MGRIILIILLSVNLHCLAALPGFADSLANIIGSHDISVALVTSRGDTLTAGNTGKYNLEGVAKFHRAVALSHVADFDTLIHKRITVTDADLGQGGISPLRASTTATPFDISPVELLDYSLNMSDDIADIILSDRFSCSGIVGKESSALEASKLIYRFFTSDTTASATLVKAIMARESPFGRDRIAAGLPTSSAKIFHKAGTYTSNNGATVNDLAFISYPTGNGYACYSLAVFSRGLQVQQAETLIAEISRAVYTSIIVRESLTMNSNAIPPAGKKRHIDSGVYNVDDSFTWVDVVSEIVWGILDSR